MGQLRGGAFAGPPLRHQPTPPHASFSSSSTRLCRQRVFLPSPSSTTAVHSLGSGGRHTGGKKQSTQLRACSQRVFYSLHDRGSKWNIGTGEKKWHSLFFFFFCLLVMLLCSIKAPLPQHVAFPRRLLLSQLGSCDPCVLRWSLLQPLLCRLRETTTTFVVLRKGRSLPEHIFFADLFFFFCVAPRAAV